jgi:signal recognition particle GTPase
VFDQLSDRLGAIFSRLTGRGKLSEGDVNDAMREVRIALLESDVSLAAAKQFVARVKEQAIGQNVLESLTPAQTTTSWLRFSVARRRASRLATHRRRSLCSSDCKARARRRRPANWRCG